MKITYDLHIHTGLSACALEEMSPNNIVNMSLVANVQVIAITDHNSCENIVPVMEVAKHTDLLVIPGIEVETKEEIHVICLFDKLEKALACQKAVYDHLPPLKNRPGIFGNQWLFDLEDEIVGQVDRLLSVACGLSIDELFVLCQELGGVCIPAHIDRPSYSILSNLGMLPDNLPFGTLEVSRHSKLGLYEARYPDHQLIQCSDAHELGFIGVCQGTLEVDTLCVEDVLKVLKGI